MGKNDLDMDEPCLEMELSLENCLSHHACKMPTNGIKINKKK